MRHILALEPALDDVAKHMRQRHFSPLADAIRACIGTILKHWREQSLKTMPGIDQLSIAQFEDSMAAILRAIAAALETDDPEQLHRILKAAPIHGADRIAREYPLDAMLAEAGILRGSIISELHDHMQRALSEEEAAPLHELIDLAFEHSALEFIRLRNLQREGETADRFAGMRRLADLGTLVAGVAHDAANMLLPVRAGLDRLKHCHIDDEARAHIRTIQQVFQHFQNTIVNLRWLTVDAAHQHREIEPLSLHEFAQQYREFLAMMLPRTVSLKIEVRDDVPPVRISAAALSQILFNLIRNAQEAIIKHQPRGRILIVAERDGEERANLSVEDDGPGMPHEARERCFEPFFTTKSGDKGGGLGLLVVHALTMDSGGSIEVHSPARQLDPTRGTAFILRLPVAL